MKSKTEIKKWLLENAVDEKGNIDLSGIDFGDRDVIMNNIKAASIFNENQKAEFISNDEQRAYRIGNDFQRAYTIYNNSQEGCYINNISPKIRPDYEDMTKEELMKEIRRS